MTAPTLPPSGDRQHVPTDQAAPELLPCPFCGGEVLPATRNGMVWVYCMTCTCATRMHRSLASALAAWNRRADLAAPSAPAEVEGLAERFDIYLDDFDHLTKMPSADGEWMRYADHATALTAQQVENERLRGEIVEVLEDYRRENKRREKAEADLAREQLSHTGTIKQRDFVEGWADKLAYAIGGDAIGEHSSANNPWSKALAKLKGEV